MRCVWLAREQASAGVVVYVHGGAYVTGPAKVHWQWLDATVRATGMAGLLVDYGLAPQRPYPHGLDDVMAVLASLRGDGVAPLVIAGDSAGGGLAAAVCLRLRDEGLPLPSAALLISPWVDITMTDPRGAELQKRDCMLSVRMLDMAAASYAGEHDRKHPYLSPLFGDMAGLPPTLVHMGTREMFVPEDSDFVRRCRDAGVVVSLIETPGGCHASAVAVAWLPEARAVHEQMVEFVRRHVAPRQVG
ncbi:alpha/beta hydrolase [Streptomyces sp. NPDC050549]|uniref:alpha/beta hydrolase n=1 Tax=Streptomyces sp. NPDC050549 TaxID=3155406 RepID=UPI0034258454